jgi:hypothetical protein
MAVVVVDDSKMEDEMGCSGVRLTNRLNKGMKC